MDPGAFIKTIYVGDSFVKRVELDGFNKRVRIQIDSISRIRSSSGLWEYYTAEDIPDGWIVFEGVTKALLEPSGPLPNDEIYSIEVKAASPPANTDLYEFTVFTSAIDGDSRSIQVSIRILAGGIHLEDPKNPENKIIA